MDEDGVRALLEAVGSGTITPDQATQRLKRLDVFDLGFARVDHHRTLRAGFPEAIYAPGKTPEQVAAIAERMVTMGQSVLATRCGRETYEAVQRRIATAVFHETARCVEAGPRRQATSPGFVVVATGGTSDIPVAEEAALTAEIAGSRVTRLWDVGVAGIHRLLANQEVLLAASVVIVVAGMEGALPSVVAGMVDHPVIAVPTSIGYGASFGGLAALLGMLNSCAPGLAVVNIDNGFGAGVLAAMINHMAADPARSAGASS
jgi:NCAIR mutase (PurE)-related protein